MGLISQGIVVALEEPYSIVESQLSRKSLNSVQNVLFLLINQISIIVTTSSQAL